MREFWDRLKRYGLNISTTDEPNVCRLTTAVQREDVEEFVYALYKLVLHVEREYTISNEVDYPSDDDEDS